MNKTAMFSASIIIGMLVAAYLNCGDVVLEMILALTAIWIGGPLLLLTTLIGFYRTKEHGWHAWKPAGWTLFTVAGCIITLVLSQKVLHWEEGRAQSFPAQVEVELEQFHQSAGRYPNTLAELAPKTTPPRLIEYWIEHGEYAFGMEERGKIWGNWNYDRTTKKWSYSD